ncbi:MAG TPA: GNAT family N-acetyltransferase [Anaerolineae bacterium]|nr:GNAT family N-acetyltransferase [Anaerolineae bacterium]
MGKGTQGMRTARRDYSEEAGDFRRLCRFMVEQRDYVRARSTWCLGRIVDWKYGLYPSKTAVGGFCEKNASLWFDGFDELAGVAISEDGDEGFAIITAPGYRFLYEEMLQWVLGHWGGRGPHPSTEIAALQTVEAAVLERHGFKRESTFYTQHFDLTAEPAPRFPLPPGFTIVDMATHPDYLAQRLLRDDAFQDRREVSTEELRREIELHDHTHDGPIYHAPTDLCVMAPSGRLVAGCEALIDARNAEADIERVCTASDYRRRGLARAVIEECLARLRNMGLERAHITGYSPGAIALYRSLGAAAESQAFGYSR